MWYFMTYTTPMLKLSGKLPEFSRIIERYRLSSSIQDVTLIICISKLVPIIKSLNFPNL